MIVAFPPREGGMRWQLVLGALVLGACAKPEQGEMVARDPEPPRGSQAWKVRSDLDRVE